MGALKPISEFTSLPFPGGAWRLRGAKLRLERLQGLYRVRGLEQLEGLELTSANLVRRDTGYYFLITGFRKPEEHEPRGKAVGLDFGIKTHLTTSEGTEFSASVPEIERLKGLQRKLERQEKGSKNRDKTVVLIRKEHEKLKRRKDDLANKIVHTLLSVVHTLLSVSDLVVLQDENLRGWQTRYGKTVQHSVLGRVKAKLVASPQAVVVERFAPTTQHCPKCAGRTKLKLSQREFVCSCGYALPRDQHAAQNVLRFGGVTPAGRRVTPVDWRTAVSTNSRGKSCQVEAGSEITQESSVRSRGGNTSVKTRLSSAVA